MTGVNAFLPISALKWKANIPNLVTSHYESYKSVSPYKNTNKRNASLHHYWALSPSFLLPSGLRKINKHSKIKWFLFLFSSFCFVDSAGINLLTSLLPRGTALLSLGWQGKNRSLPISADTLARKQWPRPGKTFLLTYIGHYSLTIFVTNIFNNNHGRAFESQVLPICKGKILASPCLWTTFSIYSINIYLLVAYCGPDAVLTGRVT